MGRSLLLIAIAAVALVAQHPSGGGNAGAGSGSPPYQASFSAVTTLTVTAATHGKGTQPYVDGCWDDATPRNAIALSANYPTVAANGDVVVAWTGSKTGYCLIASGSASGSAGGDLTGTYPAPAIAAGAVTTAKIGDGQVTAAKIAAGDKTGAGSKIVTAGSTPADGCATFASGNLGSTGSACGSGGGGAVSSVYGRTGAVTAQSGDYSAGQVANTPAGAIAATTVQAALNELDTEKQAALGFTPENSANRGAANGYAPLDAGSRVPATSLGSGTANGSTFLAGDQTYKSVTGQVQVQNDGVNQGSPRSVLDFLPWTGGSWSMSDTGSKISVQALIDFSVVASINAVQDGELDSCIASGTNALTCDPQKPWTGTPPNGALLKVRSPNLVTAAVTITVSSLGPYKALKQNRSTQLTSGDWAANGTHVFVMDSTADAGAPAFICMSCGGSSDPNAVTAAGTLTSNAPMIGAGSKAAAVGTRSGNTTEFATISGTKTQSKQLAFDASGNIIASGSDIGGAPAPVFDTFANRPAEPCTIGTMFFADEVSYPMYWVCGSGNTWRQIVNGRKVTPPTVACVSLTLVGSATCSEGVGTMKITAGAAEIGGGIVAIPAGNWTKYFLASCAPAESGNPIGCGFVFTDTSSPTGTTTVMRAGLNRADSNWQFGSWLTYLDLSNYAGVGGLTPTGLQWHPKDRVLFRIVRATNDITVSYNTGAAWVTWGTFALAQWWGTITHYGPAIWSTASSTAANMTIYEWSH